MDSDQTIKDGANGNIRNARVPGDSIGASDKQPVRVVHMWCKDGYEFINRSAVSRDPATGKHFYALNGLKVFID